MSYDVRPEDHGVRPEGYGVRPEGYRLPDATRVGRVRLQVTGLDRSLDFYAGLLGFELLEREPDAALLGAAGTPLLELRAAAGRPATLPRLGLYHFATLLPDRASLGRLLEHLRRRRVPLGSADHAVSEALYLQDPDSHGLEIYRDRPREEWTTSGRELHITTGPLHTRALLDSAGDAPWSGMPAGTSIGHVHLHVADLDAAATFYHNTLGFDLIAWSYPGALFMSAGGYHHHLGVNTWRGPGASAPAPDEPQLLDWELVLPDGDALAELATRLRAAGATLDSAGPGYRIADPSGIPLRIAAAEADHQR